MGIAWPPCAVALAALLIVAAGPSFAQTTDLDAPIRLVPLEELAPPDEAPPSFDEDDAPLLLDVENLVPPDDTVASDGTEVEVGALGDINADDVGLLSEQLGGFPNSLWQRTRRDMVTLLLPRLPVEARSPAMR